MAASNWLVNDLHSLFFPAGERLIWASPYYMPFAWAVVLVQVGYLGRIIRKNDTVKSEMFLCFLLGIGFIPVFEQCAYYADWWYYNPCKMLFDTPWYIIVSEGFIESQIDHLKRVQTKLTLFSLQSDKCVSKVSGHGFSRDD